ncbi:hypothetical protein KI688_000581 [Linnemannia hyalina]|uniref:Single-stranded DNA binding protein Ssb-like OB fold domain-containing protein n=1 Tax=Linnemannia hyalina TaxID=64524 RepID=A0A9P8BYT1_9FUNG|nr:hypothetical protein KI688_000581 [Linnemannia hyalina]
MSSPTFINVASLVPDQHHCNLKLRVLSVETIAETIHPETGKIIQSAEAIVGDDTACILLNLKNDQVNLLARNARLQILNANVNMYRGFMRLEVNEDEDSNNSNSNGNGDGEHERPSITTIMDEDDEDGQDSVLSRDGDKMASTTTLTTSTYPQSLITHAAATQAAQTAASAALSSSLTRPVGLPSYNSSGAMTTVAAASSSMSTATIVSGSSSNSLASTASSSSSSSFASRDQMEVEMRLGTGGSVPLMEYYRSIEFTYFSTVEPVGR